MTLTLAADPLPLILDDRGAYRVGNSRICLDTIVFAYNSGLPAEQIVQHYPTVDLPDVHAVISYYLRHKSDVDAYLKHRQQEADELRLTLEAEGRIVAPEKTAEIRRRFEERQNHKA